MDEVRRGVWFETFCVPRDIKKFNAQHSEFRAVNVCNIETRSCIDVITFVFKEFIS